MSYDWKAQARQRQDAFLEELHTFLAINSIEDMTTAEEGKPFGRGVAQALEYLLSRGQEDGYETKNLDGYAGTIEYGDGEDDIGVLVHIDVVTVGEGWTTPPFEPSIRDGRIYARGALDDKGPALAAYYAMNIVKDSGLPLSKRVRFIIGTDEESGWLCMRHFMEKDSLPQIGFSPDSTFPMIHAEKGQINPTLTIPSDGQAEFQGGLQLLSFVSGDQGNSVPELAKASVRADDSTILEKMLTQWPHFLEEQATTGQVSMDSAGHLHLSLKGKPAHGMEPHVGKNAGTTLACFLQQFPFEGAAASYLSLLANILHEDFYAQNLNLACEDGVSGALTVNAGILRYSQSEGATVRLNIRYPATISREERILRLEERVAELGWTISELRSSKSHYVPKDHEVVQTLSRVYEEQTGLPAELLSSGGATYAKMMPSGVAFGPLFPGKESTAHQTDEYIEIEDLMRAMAIYAQSIYELAK
ncbi:MULTISPECIES: dipeptidase PepV [Brevibacillus]|uniref:Dipeptidase PepV n=1 Tax=Brevibacillus invocatus TaxID=173959 RepID=A0A3M8C597_9BACL|nr:MULTISPECIES: dipeptidase PepV [Brevibacillus]MCM3078111.1 dipeptidase PepV [Brevibacillus invocatus]MCM3428303.1 dipeptidase PepV [Brevibacillus invocatus]MDH4617583.1 dipeptidase PepV [Brevibacillus sp. AY1]RNB70085.1 dipeptidase PepV [Brevibacillus invocatus]